MGELVHTLGLMELISTELRAARVQPVKQRARGLSPGGLVVALAESQLVGGECFDDVQRVRADRAGALLRAVAEAPSAPTARQLAYRFRPAHIHAVERAVAKAGNALELMLGRDRTEEVTFDLDGTDSIVYGTRKLGAGRSRHGNLGYTSFAVTWAERGRGLSSLLKGANNARIKAKESDRMLGRAERLLPKGHGQITVRGDVGFYSAELMMGCRKRKMRFTFSAPRTSVMWAKAAEIDDHAWQEAIDMQGAQVAEIPFTPEGWKHEPLRLIVRRVPVAAEEIHRTSPRARRRKTIPPEQLAMVLGGEIDSTYAYSFIVSDVAKDQKSTAEVEHFHRCRAQIEERFKDLKLGYPLRHLPSGKTSANRVWLCCSLLALNLAAFICDISPAAAASGQAADEDTPLRRHAKALRRILFCVPGRIARSARQIVVHLPEDFPDFDLLNATYHARSRSPAPRTKVGRAPKSSIRRGAQLGDPAHMHCHCHRAA